MRIDLFKKRMIWLQAAQRKARLRGLRAEGRPEAQPRAQKRLADTIFLFSL